jgi:hypothetical protein
MKSTATWALIVLNVVLLVAFVWRFIPENAAHAQQRAGAAPTRGDYLVVPAEFNGISSGILVILDQTNAQLSAATYNEAGNTVEMMPKIDLKQVFTGGAAPARGGRRGL